MPLPPTGSVGFWKTWVAECEDSLKATQVAAATRPVFKPPKRGERTPHPFHIPKPDGRQGGPAHTVPLAERFAEIPKGYLSEYRYEDKPQSYIGGTMPQGTREDAARVASSKEQMAVMRENNYNVGPGSFEPAPVLGPKRTLSVHKSAPAVGFGFGERPSLAIIKTPGPEAPPKRSRFVGTIPNQPEFRIGNAPRGKIGPSGEATPGPKYTLPAPKSGPAFSFARPKIQLESKEGDSEWSPREEGAAAALADTTPADGIIIGEDISNGKTVMGNFGFGCSLEEHILYGQCVDGLCGKRANFERLRMGKAKAASTRKTRKRRGQTKQRLSFTKSSALGRSQPTLALDHTAQTDYDLDSELPLDVLLARRERQRNSNDLEDVAARIGADIDGTTLLIPAGAAQPFACFPRTCKLCNTAVPLVSKAETVGAQLQQLGATFPALMNTQRLQTSPLQRERPRRGGGGGNSMAGETFDRSHSVSSRQLTGSASRASFTGVLAASGSSMLGQTSKFLSQTAAHSTSAGPRQAETKRTTRAAAPAVVRYLPGCGYFCSEKCQKRFVLESVRNAGGTVALNKHRNIKKLAILGATAAKDLEKVSTMLENSADVNITDEKGQTPLHLACRETPIDFLLVQRLVAGAFNVLAYQACQAHDKASLAYNQIPDLTLRNTDGDTPLHLAAKAGDLAVTKLIANAGGDPRIPNLQGKGAHEVAGSQEVYTWLSGKLVINDTKDQLRTVAMSNDGVARKLVATAAPESR